MTLSPTHIVLMIIASIIVTPPLVLLVPHARQSPGFDRLLWGGTLLTAFLGTWLGIANWSDVMPDPSINDVPVLPILAGALGGAIVLNALLFMLDRLEKPDEYDEPLEPDDTIPPDNDLPPPNDDPTPEPEARELVQEK